MGKTDRQTYQELPQSVTSAVVKTTQVLGMSSVIRTDQALSL